MKFMQVLNILNINSKKISFINFSTTVCYEIFIKLRNIFNSLKVFLLKAFATLRSHINYLLPNIEYMTILYIYHNLSCICY